MSQIRILIADDHEIVRRGLVNVLSGQAGWCVVGEARDGREAIDFAAQLIPDVAVIDITMPEMNGIDVTREISRTLPAARVVILTMHCNDQLVRKVLEAGAHAYVVKTETGNEIVAAIEAVLKNDRFFTTTISETALDHMIASNDKLKNPAPLTQRERQIVQLLASGSSNKQAAADLKISLRTVEKHRANIMHKLHLHSLGDLVHFAIGNGLVK